MRTTTVVLTDDLNGEDAAESVLFSLDGKSYVIDLSADNAAALRDAFKPYADAARRSPVEMATSRRGQSTSHHGSKDLGAVRDWLRGKGHTVPAKGRIPLALMQEYELAH